MFRAYELELEPEERYDEDVRPYDDSHLRVYENEKPTEDEINSWKLLVEGLDEDIRMAKDSLTDLINLKYGDEYTHELADQKLIEFLDCIATSLNIAKQSYLGNLLDECIELYKKIPKNYDHSI